MYKTYFSHLICSECGTIYSKDELHTFCKIDNKPLLAVYDIPTNLDKSILKDRPNSMWRYREMLPVENPENIVSLGEGMTPMLSVPNLAKSIGLTELLIKDESVNPTGSFKSRGLSMAISKAKEYGVKEVSLPTAGNAGSATSAYAARAGMKAYVYMPIQTPDLFKKEVKYYGANLTEVDGNIADAGKQMSKDNTGDWFPVSTLKEPYRIEGKKTMGYEIAEQLNWETPDVIVYPTGGGTGLIGIWKAFKELKAMGWIDAIKTRMVVVQVDVCDPMVQAFHNKQKFAEPYQNPGITSANGLRVPSAFGDRLILSTLYESNGTALSLPDAALLEGVKEIAQKEGLFVAPEGGAIWMALKQLVKTGWVKPNEKVVLVNTGSAYKYIENL